MRNKITVLFCLIISQVSWSQSEKLSEQELQVIKSYRFNLADSEPILVDLDLDSDKVSIEKSKLQIDLLPLDLQETNYPIKPLAHQPSNSRYYKGYARAEYGNLQHINVEASYNHMVPNYFIYGITARYNQIKDQTILDKNENVMAADAFLRYFLNKKTWVQYSTSQQRSNLGVFGFNTSETISNNGDNYILDLRRSVHKLQGKSQFSKLKIDLDYNTKIEISNNATISDREQELTNNLKATKSFNKGYAIDLDINNEWIVDPISSDNKTNLTQAQLGLSLIKNKVGFRTSGLLSYYNNQMQIKPNAEFYLQGKNHTVSLSYTDDFSLFNYKDVLDINPFIQSYDFSNTVSEQLSYGINYKFNLKNSHNFSIGAKKNELSNTPTFVNTTNNVKMFDVHYIDYQSYSFNVGYEFRLLKNLSFNQSFEYLLLDGIEKEDLQHIPTYHLTSVISYSLGKLSTNVSYQLDDKVFFSAIEDYNSESDYGHNIAIDIEYNIHEQFRIYISGTDLLDNRYERLTGYKGYGRNFNIGIKTKF